MNALLAFRSLFALSLCGLVPAAAPLPTASGLGVTGDAGQGLLVQGMPHERRMPFPQGGTVRVVSDTGHIAIRGSDRRDVLVRARDDRQPGTRRARLDVTTSRDTIVILTESGEQRWWSWLRRRPAAIVDLEVAVPRSSNLEVSLVSGAVDVVGIDGSQELTGISARFRLQAVGGIVRASTYSGDIDIELHSAVEAPELELDTVTGDVRVALGASAAATIDFRSPRGELSSDYPLVLRRQTRRGLVAVLNADRHRRPTNDVRITTLSGRAVIHRTVTDK